MPTLVFTASGTWSPPADWPGFATKIECVGAGGNGSARIATTRGGNGGGGGEYAAESGVIYISGSKSYTIGTGGSGTATSFPADTVTITAHAAGNATAAASGNGSGGTGSTNTIHFNGGAGRATPAGTASGGGGGGAAGPNGAGSTSPSNLGGAADNSTVAAPAAGNAGNSGTEWATGGCGTGGSGFASGTNNGTAGGQAGGGGAGASDGGAASTGGTGGHGLIAITYTAANLVPSLGSAQVIVYPPPQHIVLAPGSFFYRQRVADLPPSTVNIGFGLPPQPTTGVAAFGPLLSPPIIGVAATQPVPPAFTPQIGALPAQATTSTGQPASLAPVLSEMLSAAITTSAAPPPPFGIEVDASPTFVGIGTNSGRNSLGVTTGETPLLGGVAATAPNIALTRETIAGPLAAVFTAGAAMAYDPAVGMVAAPAAVSTAVSLTPNLNLLFTSGNAVANPGIIAATTSTNALAGVFTSSAFGIFAGVLNLFPAQSSIQVITYPEPQFNVLLPAQLYYHAIGEAIPGVAVPLPAIQALAQVNSFGGFAVLASASAQSQLAPFTFSGGVLPVATTAAAAGLFQPANLLPASSGISVLVYPVLQHNVVRPGLLYYRAAGYDALPLTTILLQSTAALATVGQIGPALYAPAADPIGTAEPFASTAPFIGVIATSAAPPLSIFQPGLPISISATGTAEAFGPSALLAQVIAAAAAAPFVSTAVILSAVSTAGQAAPFPTSVTLGAAQILAAINSFGLVPPLIATSAVGTPAIFTITDAYTLTAATAAGQVAGIAQSPIVALTAVSAAGVAHPIISTFILIGAAAHTVVEPFSFANLRNIPMAWSAAVAGAASFLPDPSGIFAASSSLAAVGNLLSAYLLPFTAISTTANVQGLIARPALLGAAAQGAEGLFFGAEQVPLLPLAIALGQTEPFGVSTVHMMPVMSVGATGELILEIIAVPARAPFTPIGRGRLVVSPQPNRIRRMLH